MILGTTLFSLTPLWRSGADAVTVLERVAAAGCGPALEVIGHQSWPGFPALSAEDEKAFRDAVDRLGLVPVALGVYTDLYRRPGRALTTDEALDELRAQFEVAARLGFRLVRATLGMEGGLLRRALAEAERYGVVLTFEIQGSTAPDAPAVADVLKLRDDTGSPYLGFTIDFSLTTPALPAALGTALRRLGLAEDAIATVHRVWERREPLGAAIGVLGGNPILINLVAGLLVRCGHSQPADWRHVLPAVHHAHAKFWDPAVAAVRSPHGAWLSALAATGYGGAVVSEWGGHELLDRADADPVELTRAHLELLAEMTAVPRPAPGPPDGAADHHHLMMSAGLVDACTIHDGRAVLGIRLPWYRSLPLSCLEAVEIAVAGAPVGVRSVAVPGFTGPVAAAAGTDTVWDLRDLLQVTLDPPVRPGEVLDVRVAVRIPYIQQAPGVPLVQYAAARTEATIR